MMGHYSKRVLEIANNAIAATIRRMPQEFTTEEFIQEFDDHHSIEYEQIIRAYMVAGRDRAHAMQVAHLQLMHTVNNKFSDLVKKTGDCPNPKGGEMSTWRRR